MNFFGSSDVGSQMQGVYKQQQTAQNQGMGDIYKGFAGFTPQFYDKAQMGYLNQNLPSIEQQGLHQQRQLGYGMANQGLFNSGAMNTGQQGLHASLAAGQRQVASGAMDYRNAIQQMVEQQRAQLMQQLQMANSPYGMQQQILGQAASMGGPNPMASIGQALGGAMQLGTMAAAA